MVTTAVPVIPEVVSLKLVNGDEVIARYEDSTVDTITITSPLAITIGAQGLGMIPWLFVGQRTIFFFYAVALSPWLVLLVVYAIMRSQRSALGQILSALFVIAVVVNFIYFLPILDAQPLSYDQWHARMWFRSWI